MKSNCTSTNVRLSWLRASARWALAACLLASTTACQSIASRLPSKSAGAAARHASRLPEGAPLPPRTAADVRERHSCRSYSNGRASFQKARPSR